MTIATAGTDRGWNGWHFAALLGGNVALALGPLWVRLADTGPVSAGFWRLALAIPFFALLARSNGQRLTGVPRGVLLAVLAGGVFFALDLSSWHLGIELTRLGETDLGDPQPCGLGFGTEAEPSEFGVEPPQPLDGQVQAPDPARIGRPRALAGAPRLVGGGR